MFEESFLSDRNVLKLKWDYPPPPPKDVLKPKWNPPSFGRPLKYTYLVNCPEPMFGLLFALTTSGGPHYCTDTGIRKHVPMTFPFWGLIGFRCSWLSCNIGSQNLVGQQLFGTGLIYMVLFWWGEEERKMLHIVICHWLHPSFPLYAPIRDGGGAPPPRPRQPFSVLLTGQMLYSVIFCVGQVAIIVFHGLRLDTSTEITKFN